MCAEMLDQVLRLMEDLKISQAELVRKVNSRVPYTVTRQEFNRYLKGYQTPKAMRVLKDALDVLIDEQKSRQTLLDKAQTA